MAVGQRQRLYSGDSVRMFTGNYLSSTPRDRRIGGGQLELKPLMCVARYMLMIRVAILLQRALYTYFI
jgi:hypothetical protein